MQVHRSKGVTTLKLTKREQDTLKAAWDLTGYIAELPDCDQYEEYATQAAESLGDLLETLTAPKETVAE